MNFAGRTVLVTGGASGIGRNIVHAFAKAGAQVFFCDKDRTGGRAVVDEMAKEGVSVDYCYSDLAAPGSPQELVRESVRKAGRLDVLVNNARSGQRTSLLDESELNWDETFAVTLRAAFFTTQEAIRAMSKGGGAIVNVSSIASMLSCHESPSYHAAKAGLSQLTRYLADHAGDKGIRVNCVVPAFIVKDEHWERFAQPDNEEYRRVAFDAHPISAVGRSDDVADAVLFLASDKARFISGQCLVLDGGMSVQDQSVLLMRSLKK